MIEVKSLSDSDLELLHAAVVDERRRRTVLVTAAYQSAALNREHRQASGYQNGADWVQPQGAHDAYMKDDEVTHSGKTWISLHDFNVHAPGVSGWREKVAEGNQWPEWVQPSGAHDAYKVGDKVTFAGSRYVSLINGNVWSPAARPAGWRLQSS